jgi:broad specificity phosphatase PhoE
MIRHAESMNNEVYRNARHLFQGGTPNFDLPGWKAYVDEHRTADPTISSTGIQQAHKLKEYLSSHLIHQASCPVQIIISPMRRTLDTILPTLHELQLQNCREKEEEGETNKIVDVIVNGLYFESEGCHLLDQPQPGMNQHQIKDILNSSNTKDTSFVGFDQNPNLGWYNYGTGPETRSESEGRSAAFYTWLCEYLDEQLIQSNTNAPNNNASHEDIYDAGVSLPEESHEIDHDKLSKKIRRRRTVILVGHGDFMSLCLKRIISGFGFVTEHFGVPHRTAITHFNTGITELEYFGKGKRVFISSTHSILF